VAQDEEKSCWRGRDGRGHMSHTAAYSRTADRQSVSCHFRVYSVKDSGFGYIVNPNVDAVKKTAFY